MLMSRAEFCYEHDMKFLLFFTNAKLFQDLHNTLQNYSYFRCFGVRTRKKRRKGKLFIPRQKVSFYIGRIVRKKNFFLSCNVLLFRWWRLMNDHGLWKYAKNYSLENGRQTKWFRCWNREDEETWWILWWKDFLVKFFEKWFSSLTRVTFKYMVKFCYFSSLVVLFHTKFIKICLLQILSLANISMEIER